MGSNGPAPTAATADLEKEEITVLVTGFGPFKAQYPINPSWEITKALPPLITLVPIKNPSALLGATTMNSTTTENPTPSPKKIRILTHPHPIRVSYPTVRALIPHLITPPPRLDFIIHIGMAGGRDFYSIEKRAHRTGYWVPDIDGCIPGDESQRPHFPWRTCPEILESGLPITDICQRWRTAVPDLDVRTSEDAGHYLCDFIYYTTLAHLWSQDPRVENRPVVFLHVPVESDDEAVSKGVRATLELIKALVASREAAEFVERASETTEHTKKSTTQTPTPPLPNRDSDQKAPH